MASITKINILIIAIIAISGDAQYAPVLNSPDDDIQSLPENGMTRSFSFLQTFCDGIFPCRVPTEMSYTLAIDTKKYEVTKQEDQKSTHFQFVDDKLKSRRERREAVVKTKDSNDGPNSVKSLEDRSSSPLKSMIRNRYRRSSSITETSSVKITTPAPVTHRPRLTNKERFLVILLSAITPSFIEVTPHEDFYDDSQIYYS